MGKKTGNQNRKNNKIKKDRNKRQRPSVSIKSNCDIQTNKGGSFFYFILSSSCVAHEWS